MLLRIFINLKHRWWFFNSIWYGTIFLVKQINRLLYIQIMFVPIIIFLWFFKPSWWFWKLLFALFTSLHFQFCVFWTWSCINNFIIFFITSWHCVEAFFGYCLDCFVLEMDFAIRLKFILRILCNTYISTFNHISYFHMILINRFQLFLNVFAPCT